MSPDRNEPANPLHRAIYLTGPTAVGKSAVGLALSRRLNAEVVALDSMTIYRGMDIGTAKPSPRERDEVPHHLLDMLDPWESASVALYRGWALEAVEDIESRGRRALFVGGTPLYLKALLRGLCAAPKASEDLRRELLREAERAGEGALHRRLLALDQATGQRLHPHDHRRVVRALEVIAKTGRRLSEMQNEHDRPAPASVLVFALERARPELRARINQRVVQMFTYGLVDEVRRLLEGSRPLHHVPAQAVGYQEVTAMLRHGLDRGETIAKIQKRTQQFAKRQSTWFRSLCEVRPWPLEPDDAPELTAARIAALIERAN
jgi:tRNA dimethylallyltransferase